MTGAEREIRRRIAEVGAITFSEFMETALYHPDGYYATRRRIGAEGDYFTSPVAHPTFGALIGVQLQTMWETLDRPNRFWAIEVGAGDGVLARDCMSFATRHLGDFGRALRYVAIDRTSGPPAHRARFRFESIAAAGVPLSGVVGCVLSNELFDAFPVHRFEIVAGRPREVFVGLGSGGEWVETLDEPTTPVIEERLRSLERRLPDGYRGEVNERAASWIRDAADAVDRGYLLTIDYGYETEELYSEPRARGTLQTYYRHVDGSSPYQRIGRQDLTAHVDFSALIDDGRASGLRPAFLTSQAEFLRSLGLGRIMESSQASQLGSSDRRGIRELMDPSGLGGFSVLAQEKGTGIRNSAQLVPDTEDVAHLALPRLRERHMRMGRPSATSSMFSLDELWPDSDGR